MIELLLILLLCVMLGSVALGHWIIYGDPNSKIFTLANMIVGMGRRRRKPEIQIEAVMGPRHGWVAINNHAIKRVRSNR